MPFQPQVNQELTIDDVTYRIAEHPSAPGIPYGQEGRQAIVYQLVSPSPSEGEGRGEGGAADRRALKVFKPRYRLPELVSLAGRIAPLSGLSGLHVCQRTVLTPQPHAALLRQYPDLTYSVLMPWVEGPTWMEVLVERRTLMPEEGLALARSLAGILATMEQRRLAHCDLSGPNVLLPALLPSPFQREGLGGEGGVALVDVEQLYGPGLERPELLPGGSPGYAHKTAPDGLWGSTADRFAGAVLLGEMLGWCDERVREASWGDNYFDPDEMQREGERFQMLVTVLQERWGAGVAGLFERAWRSEVLADCATFGEWLVMLPEEVPTQEAPSVSIATEEPGPGQRGAAEDALRVLMDLGRQFEEQGQLESALQTYRRACELAPTGSGLAGELALIVQDLERKQREATVPEPPPLPVEVVVGSGTPVRPPAEEAEAEVVPAEPQPLPEEGMAAEAETAAPPPKLPSEEAAVEPVAPTPGSALEKELALIAEGAESKPQEEAPPFELQPSAVEAEAEVTVPPAGEGADLDRLFDDGLAAYGRGEWAKAKELLREVVRRQPVYERDGYEAARTLLAEAERRLAPARRKRVSGWAWALLGLVLVIANIIYSNYQAERRALIEALKATASAQYQATVTVQAQATATTRAQATAQARASVADSCNPNADQVALFVDSEYSGQCVVKGIGQYSNPGAIGLPNDSISSIMIGGNVQATLYEHDDFQGRSEVFTSADSSLRSNIIDDNAVSSVKVQWRTSAVETAATAQAQDRATAQARAAATVQARATATVQAQLGVITLENVSRVQRLRTLVGHYGRVTSVAFSPDGTLLASGSDDYTVRLWRSSDGTFLRSLQGHTGYVKSVAFSPDGTILASGSDDNTVRLWQVSDGALLRTLKEHTNWVEEVVFSPDGRLLASGSCAKLDQAGWCMAGEIRLWLVPDGSVLQTLKGHTDRVTGVAFSPDGETLASGSGGGTPQLWQVANGTPLRSLGSQVWGVSEVSFSPDGQALAAVSLDETVRLWQIEDGSLLQTLPTPGGATDVAFSPEGTLLVAVGGPENSPKIWFWRIPDGTLLSEIDVGEGEVVRGVAFNPLGNLIAAAFHDGAVRLYGIK